MITIPTNEMSFSFSRSSGPGGQNVNKVNSKVTLTWNIVLSTSCHPSVKERFYDKFKQYIVEDCVVIISQKSRSQNQNIDDCIEKLHSLLARVEFAPKVRKATRPTKSSVKKRLESKKINSSKKKLRSEKF